MKRKTRNVLLIISIIGIIILVFSIHAIPKSQNIKMPEKTTKTLTTSFIPTLGTDAYYESQNQQTFFTYTYQYKMNGYTQVRKETGSVQSTYSYVIYEDKSGYYWVNNSTRNQKSNYLPQIIKEKKDLKIKYPIHIGDIQKTQEGIWEVKNFPVKVHTSYKTFTNAVEIVNYNPINHAVNHLFFVPYQGLVKVEVNGHEEQNFEVKNVNIKKQSKGEK